MTTSSKVKSAILVQGRKKNWLASELGISRPALDRRLNDNYWKPGELLKLQELGLID